MRFALWACTVLIAASFPAAAEGQHGKWIGRVSDVQCGKNVDPECNRKCIHRGVPPALVLDATGEVLSIANQDAIKPYAGDHVEVGGKLIGNALDVSEVTILESAASTEAKEKGYRGDYQVSANRVIGISTFVGDDGKKVLLFSDYRAGSVRELSRLSEDEYEVGPGLAVRSPTELKVRFVRGSQDGPVQQLIIRAADGTETTAARMAISEQEIRLQSGDGTLAGTLVSPESKQPVPAVILLHGSGPLTRYSFGPYPGFFASLGFAVLVYDKRSAGDSTGEYLKQDEYYPQPLVRDAIAAIHFLQTRKGIKRDSIGLWGSSEGGMLTTQVASQTKDVAFIINSSGFMMPLWREMLYNRGAQLRADGFSGADVTDAVNYQKLLFRAGQTGAGREEIKAQNAKLRGRKWFPMFFEKEAPSLQTLRWRWQHVYRFDPLPALGGVHCPVLGLFGALDTSTPAGIAIANMRRMLAEAGNKDLTLKLFPNANHSLTQTERGSDDEIPRAKGLAPGVFDTLRSWLSERVRSSN